VSFKDYCVFRCDRPLPRCGGSVLILCKRDLDPILLKIDRITSGCELVVSVLNKNLCSDRILVASIYKSPDVKINYRQWRDLFDGLLQIDTTSHVLVLNDLNAQSETWELSKDDGLSISLNKYFTKSFLLS